MGAIAVANFATNLIRSAEAHPDKVALIFREEEISFGALHASVARAYAGLRQAGFQAGDKLALMLPSIPEFIVLEHAVFALGGVVIPMNVHYLPHEIEIALKSCDVEFFVIQDAYASRLSGALFARLPCIRCVFVAGERTELAARGVAIHSVSAVLNHPIGTLELVSRDSRDLALMLHTSATTGSAKSVMLSIGNLQFNYDQTPAWLGLGHEERILCALPLYNTFGLNQCINAIMVTGATLILVPSFDVLEILRLIQHYRATFLPAVPTMLQKLLNDPQTPQFDITSLTRLLVGAAPVPAPLLEKAYRSMGADTVVMTGYGLTEATALVSLEHARLDSDGQLLRPKSVGKPLPGMQMKVIAADGAEAPPGVIGQVVIKGPNLMQGYYKVPEESAAAVVDGWLQTGDLGTADAQGFFYIVDRQKDLIIRGGQNIYPADIEEQLYAHPSVAEAAVIGRPDEVFGEVPEAYISFKPGLTAQPEDLIAHCQAKLAYFKVPKRIHVLNELPKGPTGKILRRSLRAPTAD